MFSSHKINLLIIPTLMKISVFILFSRQMFIINVTIRRREGSKPPPVFIFQKITIKWEANEYKINSIRSCFQLFNIIMTFCIKNKYCQALVPIPVPLNPIPDKSQVYIVRNSSLYCWSLKLLRLVFGKIGRISASVCLNVKFSIQSGYLYHVVCRGL